MALQTQPVDGETLQAGLAQWREALGGEHVVAAGDEVTAANRATFAPTGQVLAIIRPSTTPEVQACMRIAHALRIPVYPVSRGRNWGYGSRTPVQGAAVLMELRRMDRVLEFSEELAYVRVQPGVTFAQLAEFLDARGSALQIHATAGPADGSMIGNTLERGQSHGPSTSAGRGVGDFQVVLADGRVVHTSSRRFARAPHGATEPFPAGPDATGMFFESNVGIVTEMTVSLTRRWKDMRVLRLGLADQDAFRRVLADVRDLMQDGVLLPRSVLFNNEYRMQSAGTKPWVQVDDEGESLLLPNGQRARMFPMWASRNLAWACNVTLCAPDPAIGERLQQIARDVLAPHAEVVFEATLSGVASRPNPEYAWFPLWTKETSEPRAPDLDHERIGYVFVAPVVPAVPQEVSHVYATMCKVMLAHGFEPFINLRYWEPRSLVFVGSLVYDRDEPGADERALRCYEALMGPLGEQGYLPYRIPTFGMQRLPRPTDDWGGFWADVKRALDPHDVLSPGRYDFRYAWPD
jgi:4-cresol dehydrogenase (hydroxylating)